MGKEINRTVSLALVCAGLGLATATWVARGEADRAQLEVTGERLRSLREMHARHLTDAAQTMLGSTRALAREASILAAAQGRTTDDNPTLAAAAQSLGALSGVVLDRDGRVLVGAEIHGEVAVGALLAGMEALKRGELPEPGFSDIAPYAPRDGQPRGFTIAPIRLPSGEGSAPGGTESQELDPADPMADAVGFLALEVSTDRFNYLLTGGGRWRSEGLGDTGEVYLVGSDRLMRTESRFLSEDSRDEYAKDLAKSGLEQSAINRILSEGSSILLQRVDTEAVSRALAGEAGTELVLDYRGVEVLSSYTGLEFGGTRYALLSEMDASEIRGASGRIANDIVLPALLLLSVVGVLAYLVGARRTWRWRLLRKRTYDLAVEAGADVIPPIGVVEDEVNAIRSAVTALESAVGNSRRRSEFLRSVLDADPSPTFVCSYPKPATQEGRDDLRILDVSGAAMRLTGLSRMELSRIRLSDVLRPVPTEAREDSESWVDDLRNEGSIEGVAVELLTEGRERLAATIEGAVSAVGEEDEWFIVLAAHVPVAHEHEPASA